jgi:hypothetical protein
VDDYGIIDSNVPIQGAPFPSTAGAASSLSGVSAVPEPATPSMLILAGVGAMPHRRRLRNAR